jgi:uncharacterized protein YfaS (alpha-2-macroglobulin family)
MSDPTHVIDLVDDFIHELLPSDRAAEVERHCADCESCRAALDDARRRLAALRGVPPLEPAAQLVENTVRAVTEHDAARRLRVKRVFKWLAASLAAAAVVLGAFNVWYLFLEANPNDLVVLGQSELLVSSMASMRVRLMDRKTDRPVEGVPVTMTLRAAGGAVFELASFKTDNNGVGQPRFAVPDVEPGDYDLTVKADVSGSPEVVTRRVRLVRSWRILLTSDKPVYQPGQTIHMRALALRQPAGKPVGEETATLTVTDPKGNVIFKQSGQTSKFGITAADCALADELIEGNYTLACRVGDTDSRLAVSVSKYVLPKLKLAVEFDRPYYQPGDRAKCTIRAEYFFGKPVAGAEVRVEVRSGSDTLPPETIPVMISGPDGHAIFDTNVRDLVQERDPDAKETKLTFHVTVTDSAGQKQTADLERLVTRRPVRIEVIPEGGTLVREMNNTVYFLTTTADGKPTPVRLRVTGEYGREIETNDLGLGSFVVPAWQDGLDWTVEALDADGAIRGEWTGRLECGRASKDFLLRTDRAVYRGGDTMNLVAEGDGKEPVFVDFIKTDGVRRTILSETIKMHGGKSRGGQMTVDLPPDVTGTLLLSAYRFDAEGRALHKTRVVYVQPPEQLRLAMVPASGAKEYRPRDTEKMRLALTDADGKPAPGAFGLAAVDEAVFSVPGTIANASQVEGLDAGLLRPVYALYPWSPDLSRGAKPDELRDLERALFAATAWGSDIVPGHRSSPSRRVVPQYPYDIQTLHGATHQGKVQQVAERREWWRGKLRWAWIALLIAVSAVGYGCIWAWVNLDEVRRLHRGFVMSLAPIALLVVTVLMTKSTVDNASNTFSYVSTQVKGSGGVSTRTVGALQPVVRNNLHQLSTFDASVSMAGQEDGSVLIGGELGIPMIREHFPETLLWQPQLITDDAGRAEVDLTFADSITTWRLSATAVDADGRLGASELPLRVVRPFFVDFNLPVSLTRNDEVSVPVVVHNYTDKPQTVTLTLSDADWFARSGGPDKPLVVEPGKVAAAHYRLTAKRAGTFTLEVRADGQGVRDALKRNIEIVPDGRRVDMPPANGSLDRAATVPLTVPAGVIDGSMRAQVKIYPSSFSQLLEGLDGIFRLPSGCFEQTSSSLYPNVLALDYLKRTRKDRPEVTRKATRFIHAGAQRLLTFEVPGGGFEWYGHHPAVRTLTAYGLMEFSDMARVHDVDPALIARTRQWLLAQRRSDGSWLPDGHDPGRGGNSRLIATAYIAWAVFDNGQAAKDVQPTLEYLLKTKPEKLDDPYALALVANALLALDDTGAQAGPYLDRLETLKQSDGGRFAWWKRGADERTVFYGAGTGADVETTALATLALLKAKRPGSVAAALAWLTSKKDAHGTWGSTQATVLSLKALLAGTRVAEGGDRDREIQITLGDKLLKTIKVPRTQGEVMQTFDLTPHLAAGTQTLTLTETTGTASGYQVTMRYHVETPGAAVADPFFDIELTHDRTEVGVLGVVAVKARFVNRKPAPAAMVMLDLPVPPGFVPLTDDLEALQRDGQVAKFSVEPGKIVVYLRELRRERPLEVRYGLQAVQPVKAVSAGARVYEYYAPEREAKTGPVLLTVKEGR